jgi:hypothetical protein
MSGDRVRIWIEVVTVNLKLLYQHSLGKAEENQEKSESRYPSSWQRIQLEDLPIPSDVRSKYFIIL